MPSAAHGSNKITPKINVLKLTCKGKILNIIIIVMVDKVIAVHLQQRGKQKFPICGALS